MRRVLTMAVALFATQVAAEEAMTVFRSVEDPATPPDATVCAQAPFSTNVKLGASLWSVKTSKRDGRVTDDKRRQIGRATACLQLTNVMFPAGLVQRFYMHFELPQGTYVAEGTCTVSSNAVPQPFIILAGCTLKVLSGPTGSLGGMVTSNSIFNPLKRPGYSTGSMWTLQEYVMDGVRRQHGHDRDDD